MHQIFKFSVKDKESLHDKVAAFLDKRFSFPTLDMCHLQHSGHRYLVIKISFLPTSDTDQVPGLHMRHMCHQVTYNISLNETTGCIETCINDYSLYIQDNTIIIFNLMMSPMNSS